MMVWMAELRWGLMVLCLLIFAAVFSSRCPGASEEASEVCTWRQGGQTR